MAGSPNGGATEPVPCHRAHLRCQRTGEQPIAPAPRAAGLRRSNRAIARLSYDILGTTPSDPGCPHARGTRRGRIQPWRPRGCAPARRLQ